MGKQLHEITVRVSDERGPQSGLGRELETDELTLNERSSRRPSLGRPATATPLGD